MQVMYDGAEVTVGDKKYSWSNIKKIVLKDEPQNIMGVYVFGNSLITSFTLDKSVSESMDFIKKFVVAAKQLNKEVVAVPKDMIMCPTCGALVAQNAMTCPSCGHVFREQKSGGVGIIGIATAIVIAILVISFG